MRWIDLRQRRLDAARQVLFRRAGEQFHAVLIPMQLRHAHESARIGNAYDQAWGAEHDSLVRTGTDRRATGHEFPAERGLRAEHECMMQSASQALRADLRFDVELDRGE